MKLKPYGLAQEDKEEPYVRIIPERVQKLIDLYRKNHVEYPWTTEDKNEQIFEYRKSLRPNTYKYNIEAVYRVRDPIDKSKEFYFYQKKGRMLNQNDDPEYTNSLTYGFAVEPECELRWDPRIKSKEPIKIRDNPIYFLKWDKKVVAKLLEKSEEPCMNFYIGTTGRKGNKNSITDVMAVKNKHDFLEGSFDDLIILEALATVNVVNEVREYQKRTTTVVGMLRKFPYCGDEMVKVILTYILSSIYFTVYYCIFDRLII